MSFEGSAPVTQLGRLGGNGLSGNGMFQMTKVVASGDEALSVQEMRDSLLHQN